MNATIGDKVFRFKDGTDAEFILTQLNDAILFGKDGNSPNDFIVFATGSLCQLVTRYDESFLDRFETLVFLGLDRLTGESQSLGFGDVFRFDALGGGYADLYLRSVPEPTASLFLATPF